MLMLICMIWTFVPSKCHEVMYFCNLCLRSKCPDLCTHVYQSPVASHQSAWQASGGAWRGALRQRVMLDTSTQFSDLVEQIGLHASETRRYDATQNVRIIKQSEEYGVPVQHRLSIHKRHNDVAFVCIRVVRSTPIGYTYLSYCVDVTWFQRSHMQTVYLMLTRIPSENVSPSPSPSLSNCRSLPRCVLSGIRPEICDPRSTALGITRYSPTSRSVAIVVSRPDPPSIRSTSRGGARAVPEQMISRTTIRSTVKVPSR